MFNVDQGTAILLETTLEFHRDVSAIVGNLTFKVDWYWRIGAIGKKGCVDDERKKSRLTSLDSS